MEPGEIVKRFTSHALSGGQYSRSERVRDLFLAFGQALAAELPEGREESLVFTKLEEASFFATAAIARDPFASGQEGQ